MSARRPSQASPPAILLDALGTLVALEPPAPLLRSELKQRYGLAVSDADAQRAIGVEIAYYRAHLDEGRDHASLAALRRRCARALRSALPAASHVDLDTVTEVLLASLRFTAFAEVAETLKALRNRGHGLVVVSNWDVSLHAVLDRLALSPLLDGILTSAEAGARKPAKAIFERALGLTAAGPEQAMHVGNSLEEDVAGARNAGIEPVLLRRDGTPGPEGVRTIASLSELLALTA